MGSSKKIKNSLIFALVVGIHALFKALPISGARKLGAGLGRLFFYLVPYERDKTLASLAIGFPEKSGSERRELGAKVFSHLGLGAAELMRFSSLTPEALDAWVAEVRGWEGCEAVLKSGRGIVFVTAHMGHWELLAAWTARRAKVGVVARQVYDGRLDQALNSIRADKGIAVFPRGQSVKPILRWLKSGGVVGTLADQDTNVDSVYVDFFGVEAKTPSGPAWLAAATGSALMTAYSMRRPDGRYELEYQTQIEVPQGDLSKRALTGAVAEYTRRTEAFIRRAPEQWAWNHKRWRSKEEASPGWRPGEA